MMLSIKTIVNGFTTPSGVRYSVAWLVDGIPKGERIFETRLEAESFVRSLRGENGNRG
jgi:hypothetical protein